MAERITNDMSKCAGCNRCIRVCPVDEANVVERKDGTLVVAIDDEKCISCGRCIDVCQHEARGYRDDTTRFFDDLDKGVDISIIVAPAFKTNYENWGNIITYLKQRGVKHVYDVSLGADICTWAHIRYIENNNPEAIISQPCPAIVAYILKYKEKLVDKLSPVHSPMLCTAIYMKKNEGLSGRIAAISPCLAKADEFSATHIVEYNVTFKKLIEYIDRNNIHLPDKKTGFDNVESGLGSLYPMPGGLKDNVAYHIGDSLHIEKAEGAHVYKAIDTYDVTPADLLPAVFDVLSCENGCNVGTGCAQKKNSFEMSKKMHSSKMNLTEQQRERLKALYEMFDQNLSVEDFIRHYAPKPVALKQVSTEDIDKAFLSLKKFDADARVFNCGACGSDTCEEMAVKIAKGVNVPDNCIEKVHNEVKDDKERILDIQSSSLSNMEQILKDMSSIKALTETMIRNVEDISSSFGQYGKMVSDINGIATQINIISLNASIEAARAGIHGKAFAVVADEIRRLANNSKESLAFAETSSEIARSSIDNISLSIKDISEKVFGSHEEVSHIAGLTRKIALGEPIALKAEREFISVTFKSESNGV
ncbi:MAG: 4Fe-4S binding protein [Synergistaceae bacterium]|nr:4Fe-4S binding protein [Synergistaceae bacterium]